MVKEELYQNILYAVICVLVLCCTMIAHPGQGALVTGMVLMTLVAMGVSAAAGGSAWAVAVADSDGRPLRRTGRGLADRPPYRRDWDGLLRLRRRHLCGLLRVSAPRLRCELPR